jgi:hypothetical protein
MSDSFLEKYRAEHTHPVNHFLHLFVGWPMCAAAVLLLPFRPIWSVELVIGAYVCMWFGHFAFERNLPTIFRHPTTPFVLAWAVIKGLFSAAARCVIPATKPSDATPAGKSS